MSSFSVWLYGAGLIIVYFSTTESIPDYFPLVIVATSLFDSNEDGVHNHDIIPYLIMIFSTNVTAYQLCAIISMK